MKSEVAAAWWMVSPPNNARKDTMQHAAHADGADQQADEGRDRREEEVGGAQPAAKATSSLVSSTASCFMSA